MSGLTARRSSHSDPADSWLHTFTSSTEFQVLVGVFASLLGALNAILLGLGIDGRALWWRMSTALGGLRLRVAGLMGRSAKGRKGQDDDAEDGTTSDEDEGCIGSRKGRSSGVKLGSGTNRLRMRRRAEVSDVASGSNYPGMVNLSGTLCYMNSVLQAFASLPRLHEHLESVIELAEEVDLATPVTDALVQTLEQLNTPSTSSYPPPLRPHALVQAFSALPSVRRLLSTRDHQDAHELFLLLASAISDELTRLSKERRRDLGFAGPIPASPVGKSLPSAVSWSSIASGRVQHGTRKGKEREKILSPWEGLSANRRTCLKCGWCEGVRYETLGALDVAVPMSGRIRLESCLEYFTKIEVIDDAHCDACTLRLTHAYYHSEAERLALPSGDPPQQPSTSKRKRAREARKIEKILKALLDDKSVSGMEAVEGLEGVKWVRGRSRSAKQAMIARPPPILSLHLVRSEYTPYGQIVKKTPFVAFPPILDLTDFSTSGVLYLGADGPISRHAATEWPENAGDKQSKPKDREKPPRILYRLEALICHYGFTHSFGHFVAYRRKPSTTGIRPQKSCPDYCTCDQCAYYGQVRNIPTDPLGDWLRISDADVETVTEGQVLSEQGSAFLLFYEKVGEYGGTNSAGTSRLDLADDELSSTAPSKASGTGSVSALMEEMRKKNGQQGMRSAWATPAQL